MEEKKKFFNFIYKLHSNGCSSTQTLNKSAAGINSHISPKDKHIEKKQKSQSGVKAASTLLVDSQVIEGRSIDVCRWQGTAGEGHMVWRSQNEHPTTENQEEFISLAPLSHKANNQHYCLLSPQHIFVQYTYWSTVNSNPKRKRLLFNTFFSWMRNKARKLKGLTLQRDPPACKHVLHKHHSRYTQHGCKQKTCW